MYRPVRRSDTDGVESFLDPPAGRVIIPVRRKKATPTTNSEHHQRGMLHIAIGEIHFFNHALCAEEDRLAAHLRAQYMEYARILTSSRSKSLSATILSRLAAIKEKHATISEYNMHLEKRGIDLMKECVTLCDELSTYFDEKRQFLELTKATYAAWKALQRQRSDSGVVMTGLRLRAVKCEDAGESDRDKHIMKGMDGFRRILGDMNPHFGAAFGTCMESFAVTMQKRLEIAGNSIGKAALECPQDFVLSLTNTGRREQTRPSWTPRPAGAWRRFSGINCGASSKQMADTLDRRKSGHCIILAF